MKKKVLFLCTRNACRSQMAEGLLKERAGDRFEVVSAGSQPGDVHPLAVRVMGEIGIDISHQRSKLVLDFLEEDFDYVITLCDSARRTCPVFPGTYEKFHWSLEDPAAAEGTEEERLKIFRGVRDRLDARIQGFIDSFSPGDGESHTR